MLELDRPPQTEFADWHAIASDVAQQIDAVSPEQRPRIVGISGSQGSGKSTLANIVVEHLQGYGLHAVTVSLDDFYLTKAQRIALSQAVHPLLRTRVYPAPMTANGWGGAVVLQTANPAEGVTLELPTFDKGMMIEAVSGRCAVRYWCWKVGASACRHSLTYYSPSMLWNARRISKADGVHG